MLIARMTVLSCLALTIAGCRTSGNSESFVLAAEEPCTWRVQQTQTDGSVLYQTVGSSFDPNLLGAITPEQMERHRKQFLVVNDAGGYYEDPQQFLYLEDFPADRREPIRNLVRKQATFSNEVLRREERLNQMSDSQIEELRLYGVEVGLYIIGHEDDSAEVFAIHTSSNSSRLEFDDLRNALYGLLESRNIEPASIQYIDWFHTHPNRGGLRPLSAGDGRTFVEIQRLISESAGKTIPININAIFKNGGEIVGFRSDIKNHTSPVIDVNITRISTELSGFGSEAALLADGEIVLANIGCVSAASITSCSSSDVSLEFMIGESVVKATVFDRSGLVGSAGNRYNLECREEGEKLVCEPTATVP